MSEEIRILVELSRADLECSRLSGRTESIPRELDKHEAELMVHRRALDVQESHAEDLRRDRRLLEREVESTKTRRRELELQQSRIKNNAEFQAMSHEVEDLRRRATEIEDQAERGADPLPARAGSIAAAPRRFGVPARPSVAQPLRADPAEQGRHGGGRHCAGLLHRLRLSPAAPARPRAATCRAGYRVRGVRAAPRLDR